MPMNNGAMYGGGYAAPVNNGAMQGGQMGAGAAYGGGYGSAVPGIPQSIQGTSTRGIGSGAAAAAITDALNGGDED